MEHIIFVTISMAGGGSERVISTLANYYIKNSYNVAILMIGGNEVAYELDERIEVKELSGATSGSLIERVRRIRAIRKAIKSCHSPYVIAMGTVSSMFASMATIGVKCRLILSERNDPNRLNHRPMRVYEKVLRNVLYYRADKIVFQTPLAQACFSRLIQKRGEIIYNPLPEKIVTGDICNSRENRIIFMGRLTEQKNPLQLIRVFARVHKEFPKYRLELYGEGELKEELVEYIRIHNISDNVKICGRTDAPHEILQASSLYVSCSRWEGLSNSIIEAMSVGTDVVVTDCPMGGSRLLVEEMGIGQVVPVDDDEALYDAIMRALSHRRWGCEYKENVERLRKVMSVDIIANQWIN